MARPIKSFELHYPMIQFSINKKIKNIYIYTYVYINSSLHLANSFPKLEENRELRGPRTNIRAYFRSQIEAIVFIIHRF